MGDARRGFFFSHVGWLLVNKQPEVTLAGNQYSFAWLKNNRLVMFQHNNISVLVLFFCFMFPALICSSWNDFWNGLWFAGFFKYIFTLNCTWCVNSVAHILGNRPYDPQISPSESVLTAFLSMGEGWHNYHHTYPRDCATSEFGILGQYNPTKLFLDMCGAFGLATNLNRENVNGRIARKRNQVNKA